MWLKYIDETYRLPVLGGLVVALVLTLVWRHGAYRLPDDVQRQPERVPVYAGGEAATRMAPGVAPAARARAEAALAGAAWFGAYAEGSAAQVGVWTGAHSAELARSHALAACGPGCAIVAERHPADDGSVRPGDELLLRPEIARRAMRHRFSDIVVIALGGAGAWGTGSAGSGRGGGGAPYAAFLAVSECEARRAAEPTPAGLESGPCHYMVFRDIEVEDRRPERPLYPAPFTVNLARLVPVPDGETRLLGPDGAELAVSGLSLLDPEINSAFAANGEGADGRLDDAGWLDAAAGLALARCEVERRFGTPPCTLRLTRQPGTPLAADATPVHPATFEAYLRWQQTEGAGAFAIGATGASGWSHGLSDPAEARQLAADWCLYRKRQGYEARVLDREFIDYPPCRIVAERPA